VRRALLSVYDKTGIAEFARELAALGFEIVSSGGTAAFLAPLPVAMLGRPDLAGLLMKQHFIFTLTVLSIEVRLVLYNAGIGTPDGRDLVESLEAMCGQLRTLSLVVDAA